MWTLRWSGLAHVTGLHYLLLPRISHASHYSIHVDVTAIWKEGIIVLGNYLHGKVDVRAQGDCHGPEQKVHDGAAGHCSNVWYMLWLYLWFHHDLLWGLGCRDTNIEWLILQAHADMYENRVQSTDFDSIVFPFCILVWRSTSCCDMIWPNLGKTLIVWAYLCRNIND